MKLYVLFLFSLFMWSIDGQSDVKIAKFMESFEDTLKHITSKVQMHPDTGLNISQFLEKYDYPLESHEVSTEDGFFLTLHRIPYGYNGTNKDVVNKPVVLLVAGLTCSSMDWVYLGPNKSLALLLADLGYDVWLINTRGTTHSMNHKSLNSSEAAFWDYSWHEKGYYDLAASLDYITDTAKVKKITLIGHSEGTSDSMVLLATRPEYNDKINLLVLFSPIAYVENLTSPLIVLMAKHLELVEVIFKVLDFHGLPYSPVLTSVVTALCNDDSPFQDKCVDFIELFCGFDYEQFDKTFITVFVSNTPSGFSTKELLHYGQEMRSGFFRQYDYGPTANLLHYGTRDPPSYDPTKITAPVAAYYSKNDFAVAITDVKKLLNQLPNLVVDHLVEFELFNHLDFILARDVKTLLYDQVISDIQKYNPDVKKLLNQLPNLVVDHLVEFELFNHLDFILARDVKTLLYDQVISDIQKYNPVNN